MSDLTAHPPIHIRQGGAQATFAGGYTSAQIRDAYGIDKLAYSGQGQKIAIIDAFASPSIKKDVDVFDEQFHLLPADLCIYYPEGADFQNDPFWAGETSLDIEWVHALAPEVQILLVVAKSASVCDLLTAVKYAAET